MLTQNDVPTIQNLFTLVNFTHILLRNIWCFLVIFNRLYMLFARRTPESAPLRNWHKRPAKCQHPVRIHETSSISDYQFHSLFRFIIHSHVRVIPGLHKVYIRYTNSLIAVFISTDFQQIHDQFLVARYKNSWIFLNIIMNMYLPLFSAKHNNPGKIKKTKTLSMIIKGIYMEVRTHSTLLKNALLYEIYI